MRGKTIFLSSGRVLVPGKAEGPVLLSSQPLSFSRLEARTGRITDRRVDVFGQTIRGKIVVFPHHRGSTTSPAVFLEACRRNAGPLAILVEKSDPLLIFSALLAREFYGITIPVFERIDKRMFEALRPDAILRVNGYEGTVLRVAQGEEDGVRSKKRRGRTA